MAIFRKRDRTPESTPELDRLLDGYTASRPPSARHSKVENVVCWRCKRPNMYDARLSRPKHCGWCRALV